MSLCMLEITMSSLHILFLLTFTVVGQGKTSQILEELLHEITEISKAIKDPEQAQRVLILIVDILSSQGSEMKEMKSTIDNLSDQVQRLTRDNEKLTALLKVQGEESDITNNNLVDTQKKIPKEAINRWSDSMKGDNGYTVSSNTENKVAKRVLLHSDTDILSLVTAHGTEIQKLQTDIAALKTVKSNGQAGSTYVRWGRHNCSGNGTELVYAGYAAGSDYRDTGAAANYICLSPDPLWGHYNDVQNAGAKILGVEYEFYGETKGGDTSAFFHKSLFNEDAPCSVCRPPRPTVIMIPGRNQCYKGWTLEYKGYLVAGRSIHPAATEYVCLDDNPDVIPGGHVSQDGSLFYMVEGKCGPLLCPPYVDGRELTCVVCSK